MNYNEFDDDIYYNFALVEKYIPDDVYTLVHIMNSTLVNFVVCQFSNKYNIDEVLNASAYIPTLILSSSSMDNNFYFVYMVESNIYDEKAYLSILTEIFHSFDGVEPNFMTFDLNILHDKSLDTWEHLPLIYEQKFFY